MDRWAYALLTSVVAAGIAFTFYMAAKSFSFVSDKEILARTKELPEARAFLAKYPNATASVQRGSDVVVEYRVSKSAFEGNPIDPSNVTALQHDSHLYVWAIMNEKSQKILQVSLLCSGGDVIYNGQDKTGWTREHHFQINYGIVPYIEQGKEEFCFE